MKKLILTLFAISTIFTFSSCGDDEPKKIETFFTGTARHVKELNAFKGNSTTIPTDVVTLEKLLEGNTTGYGAPIVSCVFSTPDCRVNIVGLKAGVTLNDFKLKMGNIEKEIKGVVGVADKSVSLITNETNSFFIQIFDKIAKEKKIDKIEITFTPSENLNLEDNVRLEISLEGKFSYMKVVEE